MSLQVCETSAWIEKKKKVRQGQLILPKYTENPQELNLSMILEDCKDQHINFGGLLYFSDNFSILVTYCL